MSSILSNEAILRVLRYLLELPPLHDVPYQILESFVILGVVTGLNERRAAGQRRMQFRAWICELIVNSSFASVFKSRSLE